MTPVRHDRRTSFLAALSLSVLFAAAGVGCHSDDDTTPSFDTVAPTVVSTSPAAGATGVANNQVITATFSEPVNASTISTDTFMVSGAGALFLSGTVTYDAATNTARFTPTNPLVAGITYTAIITTLVRDPAGNPLESNKIWSFTAGSGALDTVAPTVISTLPTQGATGVPVNTTLSATFSEAMNAATINSGTFTVTGPGATPVSGIVSYDAQARVASFTPAGALAAGTTFTATITTGARDVAGNALATNKVWTFTTGTVADSVAPTVISTNPAQGAAGVPTNQVLTATFSEPMNAATINSATFKVTGPGATPVNGIVSYDAPTRVASFMPAGALAPSTTFTATITTGVRDVAGNALATNKVWTFTTGIAGDTTAPAVISTIPAQGATGVPTNTTVSGTFSEAMNAATINTGTFTLTGPGAAPVNGTVSYDALTRIARFTPAGALAASTTYTATITTGVRDLAGNALAANKVFTFTTGTVADTFAPRVTSTVPAQGATGVPTNTPISATFNEAMDAATINNNTFTLTGPGAAPVAGTVSYDAVTRVASFTPANVLAASTTYTATITTGAKDVAGNSLAANEVWTFTTGLVTDTVAPTVTGTNPSDGATGVPTSQVLTATFSEPMNPATINDGTFRVEGPGQVPVLGTVSYDVPTRTASFTPSSPLEVSTMYTAKITTGARDVAGNALASDKVWSFRTVNQQSVALGAVGSFGVLAGSTVTNTGPTQIVGDLGVHPGTAVTGFPPGIVTGEIHSGDPTAAEAKSDLDAAYLDAAGRTQNVITISGNLGGQTLTPGLYKSTSSLEISSGDLTLDAQGDPNAVFIFQMASTLTTTPGRAVILSGGAQANNIYWQVGTSATLGVGSSFKGTILADQSITLNTGATLDGRAVTRIGAVTLSSNTVTVPN